MISPKPETALEFSISKNNSGNYNYNRYVEALHKFLGGMYTFTLFQEMFIKY